MNGTISLAIRRLSAAAHPCGAKVLLVHCIVIMLLMSGSVWGQGFGTENLQLPGLQTGDQHGFSVSVSDDRVVVGALHALGAGADAGAVYIYLKGIDVPEAVLTGDDAGAQFGAAVAIDGERIVVGVPYDGYAKPNAGSAFVYQYQGVLGWRFEKRLVSPSPGNDDHFGSSVSISGDYIVVGAPDDDDVETNAGSATVFHLDHGLWTAQTTLFPDRNWSPHFGASVSIYASAIAVGAPLYGRYDNGAVYVFELDNGAWTRTFLRSGDAFGVYQFGTSVSIKGDLLGVGAPGSSTGKAFAFRRTAPLTWNGTPEGNFAPSNGADGDQFGSSIAVWNNAVMVGAAKGDGLAADAGAAYAYTRTNGNWGDELYLAGSDGQAGDSFGSAIAMRRGLTVMGVPHAATSSPDTGSAYEFLLGTIFLEVQTQAPDLVNFDAYCGRPNGKALVAIVEVNGTPAFLKLPFQTFMADGHARLPIHTGGLGSGLKVTFKAYGETINGATPGSAPVTVTLP